MYNFKRSFFLIVRTNLTNYYDLKDDSLTNGDNWFQLKRIYRNYFLTFYSWTLAPCLLPSTNDGNYRHLTKQILLAQIQGSSFGCMKSRLDASMTLLTIASAMIHVGYGSEGSKNGRSDRETATKSPWEKSSETMSRW